MARPGIAAAVLACVLAAWLPAPGAAPAGGNVKPAQQPEGGWHLTWSDEFNGPDGSAPDPAKWTIQTGGNGFGNHELELYTDARANLREEHGDLVLEARREDGLDAEGRRHAYTSARIQTRGHFSAQYGRIEARMQLTTGKGMWPAFWMLGADIGTHPWPACGEVDIMENIGDPHRVYGTLHGPGYSGAHGLQSHDDLPAGEAVNTGFHVYGVEWAPDVIRFTVDGQVYATKTLADLPAGAPWVFNRPFFLLLNLAVGGDWPGAPDAETVFPQKVLVDWVRVYQR